MYILILNFSQELEDAKIDDYGLQGEQLSRISDCRNLRRTLSRRLIHNEGLRALFPKDRIDEIYYKPWHAFALAIKVSFFSPKKC